MPAASASAGSSGSVGHEHLGEGGQAGPARPFRHAHSESARGRRRMARWSKRSARSPAGCPSGGACQTSKIVRPLPQRHAGRGLRRGHVRVDPMNALGREPLRPPRGPDARGEPLRGTPPRLSPRRTGSSRRRTPARPSMGKPVRSLTRIVAHVASGRSRKRLHGDPLIIRVDRVGICIRHHAGRLPPRSSTMSML